MNRTNDPAPQDLVGRELLVGVCGGIAAYKVCSVVSALVQRGAGVTVALTRAGRKFVGRATFEALCGRRVLERLWDGDQAGDCPHIRLTNQADLTLIAPATANMIGKIAHGIADDVVSTLALCSAKSMLLAPAMNDQMWENPIVQDNVSRLQRAGYQLIGPGEGWMACRTRGVGRMAEPEEIVDAVTQRLLSAAPRR